MKFVQRNTFKLILGGIFAIAVGLTHAGVGQSGSGRSYGYITDFASIFVNGVEYDISSANIIINGVSGQSQSALRLGMAVRVEGTVNPGGTTGTATLVEYLGDIEGSIDAAPVVNGTSGTFTIYGLVIKTDKKTRYDNVANLAALGAGDLVEVSGLFDGNDGSYSATRIEKLATFRKVDLRGFVSNVTATTFVLGPSLVVNYSAVPPQDLPVVNGAFVEVKATAAPVNGTLTATRVHGESSVLASPDMQLGLVQGVAANVTAGGFVMGNQPIVMNASTIFDGAPASALLNGARALASGPVVSGVLTAAAVTIVPQLQSVDSVKTHGAAGPFPLSIDISAPVNGAVTVEPRAIGSGHKLVFTFNGPVTSLGGVTSKDASGLIDIGTATHGPLGGNSVDVTLTGVADNQRATVTLTNINVSGSDAAVSIGFLVGDINRSRTVTAADISTVKARAGQTLSATNFLADINASGQIDAADLNAVKARSGWTLAP